MSLTRALNASVTGLRTSQLGLATVGHNISNADTEGYSRQRVQRSAADALHSGPRGTYVGGGVRSDGVRRTTDGFYESQARRDRTQLGFSEGRSRALDMLERLYADDREPNVGAGVDSFFNAARELAQDPSDPSLRETFLDSARNVATAINDLHRDVSEVRRDIDHDLAMKVDRVNALAAEIAQSNARIVSGEVGERDANDLRDARERAVRELADLIDVQILPQADGAYHVEIGDGRLLVQGDRAASLTAVPDPARDGHLAIGYEGLEGRVTDITDELAAGEIGGLIDVRDRVLGGQLDALDTFAFELASATNAQHRAGVGLDGVGGRDLFVALAGPDGAARAFAVDPVVLDDPALVAAADDANGLPGDNRNALALGDLEHAPQAGLGGVTFNRGFAELVRNVGREKQDNQNTRMVHEARRDQSEFLRESVAGVSVDDEMVELTKLQRHFEASSRVFTTVDGLLNAIFALLQ